MAPEGLRLFLQAAIFIVGLSLLLVFLLPRGSAEFVASVLSLITGLALFILVLIVNWWTRR